MPKKMPPQESVDEVKRFKKGEERKQILFPARMRIRDIMGKVHVVREDLSIRDLLQELKEKEESCFIVENKEGELVGLVTESDLMKVISRPQPSMGIGTLGTKSLFFRSAETVKDIMTKNPLTTSPDAKLEDAARIMCSRKIRHLPVVEGKKCIGLLEIKDILLILRILI